MEMRASGQDVKAGSSDDDMNDVQGMMKSMLKQMKEDKQVRKQQHDEVVKSIGSQCLFRKGQKLKSQV